MNSRQNTTLFAKLAHHFGGEARLSGKIIAVRVRADKPNTDDMRAAPSRVLMAALWQTGAKAQAFDPVAVKEAARIYEPNDDLVLYADKYAALQGANALVNGTEWQQFRAAELLWMTATFIIPKKCERTVGLIPRWGAHKLRRITRKNRAS